VGFYVVEGGKYTCKVRASRDRFDALTARRQTCNDKTKAPVVIDASATVTTSKPEVTGKVEQPKAAAEEPAAVEPAQS
jgi:hypothetical protein